MNKFLKIDLHVNHSVPVGQERDKCLDEVVGVLSEEPTTVDGLLIMKSVIKFDNPSKQMEKYQVNDFALENLQACGAIAGMKSCQYNDLDVDSFCDDLNELTDNLSGI